MEPEALMGPVVVEGHISGQAVIDDLCNRIAEKLAQSCDLRQTDSYLGYSAKVHIQLQLTDVAPAEVVADVEIGNLNPRLRTTHIDLRPDVTAEEPVDSLEVCVNGSAVEPVTAAAPNPRHYTRRGQQPVPLL